MDNRGVLHVFFFEEFRNSVFLAVVSPFPPLRQDLVRKQKKR